MLWRYDEVDLVTLVDEILAQDKAAEDAAKKARRRR